MTLQKQGEWSYKIEKGNLFIIFLQTMKIYNIREEPKTERNCAATNIVLLVPSFVARW